MLASNALYLKAKHILSSDYFMRFSKKERNRGGSRGAILKMAYSRNILQKADIFKNIYFVYLTLSLKGFSEALRFTWEDKIVSGFCMFHKSKPIIFVSGYCMQPDKRLFL
jgi:hypothetical protein